MEWERIRPQKQDMAEAVLRRILMWFVVTTVLSELLKEAARVFHRADRRGHTRSADAETSSTSASEGLLVYTLEKRCP